MPAGFFKRLSLTAKIATIIVVANATGLAVTSYFSWSSETNAALDTAYATWERNARQIGDIAEGGVKWKKAAAIRDAYSLYRSSTTEGMLHFEAVTGSGETVDSWTADSFDKTELGAAAAAAIKTVSDQPILDKSGPGYVTIAVPLGKDKGGQRIGFVSTTWSTTPIYDASNAKSLFFLLKQAAVITMVIVAFLLAMRVFVGKPLARLTDRIAAFEKGDLDSPVGFLGKHDEIGVIARALEASLKQASAKLEQERIAAGERAGLDAERIRFSELASEAARNQAEAIAKIAEALEQLAEGNFAARLPDLGRTSPSCAPIFTR